MATIHDTIKSSVEECISKPQENHTQKIIELYKLVYQHIKINYENSRELLQFTFGQMQKINNECESTLLAMVLKNIQTIKKRFMTKPSDSIKFIKNWNSEEMMEIMKKLMIQCKIDDTIKIHQLNKRLADICTIEERQKYVSYCIDSITRYGLQSSWTEDTIFVQAFNLITLYSICEKDHLMDLFYSTYYNVIDRLGSTGEHQMARDMAESLLMIGYDNDSQPEAYLGASRAYSNCNNTLASLFYLNISISFLIDSHETIPQKLAFELLWQTIKVIRTSRYYAYEFINSLLTTFEDLQCSDTEKISIYHTAFTCMFIHGEKNIISLVSDFLNENRESIFKQLEHSSLPWMSLLTSIKKHAPDKDYSSINPYLDIFKQNIENQGNQLFKDIGNDTNLATHLKEILVRLNSTRSNDDYAKDNKLALIIAKRLIDQAAENDKPDDFILAMLPKSDYTFVLSENKTNYTLAEMNVQDIDGTDIHLLYENIERLKQFLNASDNDIVLWIGKGTKSIFQMSLLKDMYTIEELSMFPYQDINDLQNNIISKIHYFRETKKAGEPIYQKSKEDFEEEDQKLLDAISSYRINLTDCSSRVLLVKDIEISPYPHQLLIDNNSEKLLGEIRPSCNIISTELLIMTNFNEQLGTDYCTSFWCPEKSGEFTFSSILSHLEDTITRFKINVSTEVIPNEPICADINIICAHGAKNIGETEWFYANDTPITECKRIIGKGKLLIMFVCHSGSIIQTQYDNSMHTMAKQYLKMGYSSVIAPMWSLSTEILEKWLTSFLTNLSNHEYVIDALYKANMQIKEEFIASSAWACLHLFGNPYLKIGGSPRIKIE